MLLESTKQILATLIKIGRSLPAPSHVLNELLCRLQLVMCNRWS